jgi:hypothetical protein
MLGMFLGQDPAKSILKNHSSMILRAPSGSEKFSWLARLKHAAEGSNSARTPVRAYTSTPQGVERISSATSATSSVNQKVS